MHVVPKADILDAVLSSTDADTSAEEHGMLFVQSRSSTAWMPEGKPSTLIASASLHACSTNKCDAFRSAVINRYGFNSKGVDAVRANLQSYRRGLLQRPVNKPGGLPGLVGVNLGTKYLAWHYHPTPVS